MAKLGVNIDHVATVRQARRGREPDPVWAAVEAQLAGADGITLHLREDRRHIQDRDVRIIRDLVQVKYNLEMAATRAMVDVALDVKPHQATIVPERREEITTEGGLDVLSNLERLADLTAELRQAGIEVSMFIDPDERQVEASRRIGADAVELHTGRYAEAVAQADVERTFAELESAGRLARSLGLTLHAGHGLNYHNAARIAAIPGIEELNIGHAIVSRAIFTGFRAAVREMKDLITAAR